MSEANPISSRDQPSRSRGASGGTTPAGGLSIESLVCFVINNRPYAIDVALVREVVNIGTVFPVPNAASSITGVFSLRGATVALVNTSQLLGVTGNDDGAVALVVVRHHQTMCALTIDRVVGVARFEPTHFIPSDPEREPAQVVGFMPDERGGLLTVLDSTVILDALNRLRFR